MSERKAINKYYPPDYDPLEAERTARKLSKKLKNAGKNATTVRFMTPFSIRCLKCDEFIPRSRKFNGKKELLPDRYLNSIRIYRLTLRCPRCANSISFRTDPKSADYVMETGGVRNYMGKAQDGTQNKAENEETIDETLERLAREQQAEQAEQAAKERGNSKDGRDRVQILEENLERLQKEQEDVEYLEKLREANSEMSRRAAHVYKSIAEKAEGPRNTENTVRSELNEQLEAHAAEFEGRGHKDAEPMISRELSTGPDPNINIRDLVNNSRKIKLRSGTLKKGSPFRIVPKGKIAKW